MDTLLADLRLALRSVTRRPLLGVIAAGSLAIGIGANTVLFSGVNRFLLRTPEGIQEPQRVVEVWLGRGLGSWSYPDFLDVREGAEPLEELAAITLEPLSLSRGEEGVRALGMLVSANYFEVFGVTPARGRFFLPEEDVGPGQPTVAVLGHAFWMSRFGGDPEVIGASVSLNRKTFTVVGVTPSAFTGQVVGMNPDVYLPLMAFAALNGNVERFSQRQNHWFQVVGRLRPGATLAQAQSAVSTVAQRIADEHPDSYAARGAEVRQLGSLPSPALSPVRGFLVALSGLVFLILLITCANVAGMFLARAGDRRKELALRLSLGSSRSRLIQHLMLESALVFLAGGIGGVLLATWGLDLLAAVELPTPYPVEVSLTPDLTVLAFSLALTLGTGILFGLLPALRATRLDLAGVLKDESSRGGSSVGRMRRFFVTGQVGFSLVLLVSAGLFLRSLQRAGRIETGFEPAGTVSTWLDLEMEGYTPESGRVFFDGVVDRFSSAPWVESVALAADMPLDMGSRGTIVHPEGTDPDDPEAGVAVDFNNVTVEYFDVLRIPVLQGRPFLASDLAESEPVAVVSRTFSDRVWEGESPVGRTLNLWGDVITIVGVVEDTKNTLLTDPPKPFLYLPLSQRYAAELNLVVRSRQPYAAVAPEVRRILLELDPSLSLGPIVEMESLTAVGVLPQRMAAWVTSALGLLALLLSGMGIYGVVAHSVSRRTREIGIRMALGAERGGVVRMVILGALRFTWPGLVFGGLLSLGLGRVLQSFLLGVSPVDPAALLGVCAVLSAMVLGATLVPARKAAGIEPAEALRYE
ncbi:ABC transporter permease [Gemmatimonadota bacterium]